MKKYIIKEDLLTKAIALLKIGKASNVVIEFNEVGGIISQLENLPEQKVCVSPCKARKKGNHYYDVAYTGISPVTDEPYTNQVLIVEPYELTEKEIVQLIWEKFALADIKTTIRPIQKEEFDLIKEDINLLSQY